MHELIKLIEISKLSWDLNDFKEGEETTDEKIDWQSSNFLAKVKYKIKENKVLK